MSAIRIMIEGKVQGAFFRTSTLQKARELELLGWIKNTNNGCVEIHAEGKECALEDLIKWCKKGPEDAEVKRVLSNSVPEEYFKSFEII